MIRWHDRRQPFHDGTFVRYADAVSRIRLPAACAAAAVLVILRSLVWVCWEQSYFDSDQAIVGLMAKHLLERRAFPLMFYGQPYMLAVESWLAVPALWLFGVSVASLKLPLLLMNAAVALLLVKLLVKDAGLAPGAALLSSMFFVMAPPVTASRLVEAQGGNIEPFLYTLLLWMTRKRPVAFGLIAGIGLLNREFTAYAIAAIVLIELRRGLLFSRPNRRGKAIALGGIAGVVLLVRWLMPRADLLGPGTAGTLPPDAINGQLATLGSRFCWNVSALGSNLRWLAGENLALLFGWRATKLSAFVVSRVTAGHVWALPALVVLLASSGFVWLSRRGASKEPQDGRRDFPLFLVLVGVQTIAVYAGVSCLVRDPMLVRYTLLAVFVPIGFAAMLLRSEVAPAPRVIGAAAILVWTLAAGADNGRVLFEYLHHPPPAQFRSFADLLEREGVRYGRAPYWTAYHVDFLTKERVVLGSYEKVRIAEYERVVDEHVNQSLAVYSDDPCTDAGAVRFERWCLLYFERARNAGGK